MREVSKSKIVRSMIFAICDAFIVHFSGILALLIRFEFAVNSPNFIYYSLEFKKALPFFIALTILVFIFSKIYKVMWSKASMREAVLIFIATLIIAFSIVIVSLLMGFNFPRSIFILFSIIFYALEMILRFSYRVYRSFFRFLKGSDKRIMIVGAGDAGTTLLKEIRNSEYIKAKVVCFIDDNDFKVGKTLNGVPVVGNRYTIEKFVKQYNVDEIYISIPTAQGKDRREIIDIASKTKCDIKVLPGIYQLMNGDVSVAKLRSVDIEDLLERDPVKINTDEILNYVENKTILVTGAGGSIGSEVSRQIASHNPKALIILDIYENSLYEIELEIKKKYPRLNLITLIASVRNEHRINDIFSQYKPDIVFHAAAHKHVPLMEDSPNEAIKNNCLGTFNVAKASSEYNTTKFILISTDKAVNPTSVMGASKRICEMIIEYFHEHSKTIFSAVRFGNVLGSNGSVVPIFKKQIEEGGPVTVTDENIIRYFMTIPEAVALVLQAGFYAKGGEIFILDMGKPVKIYDMAKKLIELSGYKPFEDIDIKVTGLRPGEKLYEELLMNDEKKKETANSRIFIGSDTQFDKEHFVENLKYLFDKATNDSYDIKNDIQKLVSTYNPYEDKNV